MESIGDPIVKNPTATVISKQKQKPCSEITLKQFLDFLKTAYQVDGSIEGVLLAGGMTEAVNWLKVQSNDLVKSTSCQTVSNSKIKAIEDKKDPSKKKSDTYLADSEALKVKLNEVLAEGLLDSVLPYLIPPPSSKRSSLLKLTEKSNSQLNLPGSSSSGDKISRKKSVDGSVSKITVVNRDSEVEIHVCDEVKNVKKDFLCNQKLLVEKMGYFADVTSGQKLEDMEISVHCDIDVFEWLMKWVKKDSLLEEDWPQLDYHNVVQILVSSSFLQMDPLVQDCLLYCHEHMNEILRLSVNLNCINDSLLTRLAAMYTNAEVEAIRDRKDKIQSRLFCKLIQSLAEPEPESMRGHWCSLARVYQCGKCQQHISPSIAQKVPCVASSMRLQCDGSILSFHVRDQAWNINDYIVKLHKSLKTWRKVYWRLWGNAHFLFCLACKRYFPVHQIGWCRYHPDPPQFFTLDTQKAPLPVGRYPCCGERAYRFQLLQNYSGCQFHEHTVCTKNVKDSAILTMLETYRHLIEEEPPELLFPEKLTRLVARDPAANDKKLSCKETFWWDGFEIVPPRPKLGLLSMFLNRQQSTETASQSEESSAESASEDSSSSGTNGSVSSSEESSPTCRKKITPIKRLAKKKKKRENRLWQHNLSARSNQDIQRAYEENVLKQMSTLLDRRTCDGSLKLGKGVLRTVTPAGGLWVRLETEFNQNRSNITTNVQNQPKVRNIFTGKIKPISRSNLK